MRLILGLLCLSVFFTGCTSENTSSTCEFTYFNQKNLDLPENFYDENIETQSDVHRGLHRMIDGNGNVAQCVKMHSKPGIIDSVWHESISVYYPEKNETLKLGSNEKNFIIYSAVGGIKDKKNSCHGYAKKGEIHLVDDRIISMDIELEFVGNEDRRLFCKEQFGKALENNGGAARGSLD